jgi:hypothetical protein
MKQYYAHLTPLELVEPLKKAFLRQPALNVSIEDESDIASFCVNLRHRQQFYVFTIDGYLHINITIRPVTEGDYFAEVTFALDEKARHYMDYTILGTLTIESDEGKKQHQKLFAKITHAIASAMDMLPKPEEKKPIQSLEEGAEPMSLTLFVRDIIAKQDVSDADVSALKHLVYKDHTVKEGELLELYEIDIHCKKKSVHWNDFFSDTIVDHYLHRGKRSTLLTKGEAQEVLHRVDGDARLSSKLKLLVMLKVVEQSEGIPDSLKNSLYDKLYDNVVGSSDPLFSKKARFAGAIDADDMKAIRMVIYGRGGDDGMGVSQREAELLIKLDMATDPLKNHPDWVTLYTKAIAMYFLHGGPTPNEIDANEAAWYMELIHHQVRTPAQRSLLDHFKSLNVPRHSLLLGQ